MVHLKIFQITEKKTFTIKINRGHADLSKNVLVLENIYLMIALYNSKKEIMQIFY